MKSSNIVISVFTTSVKKKCRFYQYFGGFLPINFLLMKIYDYISFILCLQFCFSLYKSYSPVEAEDLVEVVSVEVTSVDALVESVVASVV